MTVQPTSGLTEDQLESLAQEAESKKSEDAARREIAELRNRAETLIYTCERSLEAFGGSLSPNDRADIENDLRTLEAALESPTLDSLAIRDGLATLETSSHQIYEAMLADAEDSDV